MRELLKAYLDRMLDVNRTMNLTAIRDPREAWTRHIEDSLSLLNAADFRNKTCLDVGSGAGLPGMVLAIAEPSLDMTLLDATQKKTEFLRGTAEALGLRNVKCVHARAEEYAHTAARESFDIVTARGVAALGALCEICLPFLSVGGLFLAMKEDDSERADAENFGGAPRDGHWYELPGGITHYAAIFEKVSPTPAKYPRKWAAIKK
ncbi:MAG: 16S rRNA (guanine(527)-N(7))-methyltransferase RsmG [Oscillospiraceae bacterium]|jgi:16S rRNA (guanine527-N7)-methyltransferase|nr:16S rRNA (guanine(527)-N(7))-methyltransferase RsmG [Oscillospiraceae bacterium]